MQDWRPVITFGPSTELKSLKWATINAWRPSKKVEPVWHSPLNGKWFEVSLWGFLILGCWFFRGDHIVPNFEEIWPSKKGTKAKPKRGLEYYWDAMQNGPELSGKFEFSRQKSKNSKLKDFWPKLFLDRVARIMTPPFWVDEQLVGWLGGGSRLSTYYCHPTACHK